MTVHVPLRGSRRTLLPYSRPAGRVDPNEPASVTVRVRSRGNPRELVQKAYDLARTPLGDREYLDA